MSTFIQYLIEQTEPDQQAVQNTAEILLRDCQPFFEQIDYRLSKYQLFRGVQYKLNYQPETYLSYHQTKTRVPRDTAYDKHITFDDMFQHVFGHRYRSNAIFASGDSHHVDEYYGHPYRVFPIGQFSFLWSPRVTDLYGYEMATLMQAIMGSDFFLNPESPDIRKTVTGKMVKKHRSGKMSQKKTEKMFTRMADKLEYTTKNLKKAIKSHNEIMIAVPSFYMIDQQYMNHVEQYINENRKG